MVEAWREGHLPDESRVVAMVVIATLFGGGSLVLSGERAGEDRSVRTVCAAALLSLIALGTLTVLALSDVHIGVRWFGVAAAVFLVSTLSLPVLRLAVDEGS